MASVLCMIGAVGAAVAVLLIVVLCLMGKKAVGPLVLFALSLAAVFGSGFLPAESPAPSLPWKADRPAPAQATPVSETVEPEVVTGAGSMVSLGSAFVSFDLYELPGGTGEAVLAGYTTKSVIENITSAELTAFMEELDFTGTNGTILLLFGDGTGLTIRQPLCTVYADYGYIDDNGGRFAMTGRLGAVRNDPGDPETGWYYTTIQEMQTAKQIVTAQRNPNKYPSALDNTMDTLLATLTESFGEGHCAIEYDETSAAINVRGSTAAQSAAAAAAGDESAVEAWNLMVTRQQALCNTIRDQVRAIGQEDYYVTLHVLNDQDTSKVLLSVLNGFVIYDAVNG